MKHRSNETCSKFKLVITNMRQRVVETKPSYKTRGGTKTTNGQKTTNYKHIINSPHHIIMSPLNNFDKSDLKLGDDFQ